MDSNQTINSNMGPESNKPTTQSIAEVIASLSEQQKKDLLGQIKESALKDNPKTRHILNQSPQLAYALFHTMNQHQSNYGREQNAPREAADINQQGLLHGLGAEQSRQIVTQVMSLTPEQIQQLPLEQQQQLLALQAQISRGQDIQRF
ncbi:hypothetical protein BB561_003363 [Smittium simulii]|uniref:Transcription termination and cleavage factor C-terminal domain-containing protein n=1 Tax=Smittium simulii TaxID=133385 RepID=A0A2T9YLS2_9FUNG|nr:hypothetical protein BB561_003363 [Smittium simulii]